MRDGALAGDHVGVVERMDEGQALLALQRQRVRVGVGVAVAVQHHLAAERLHGVDLELRRGHRHHDHGAAAQTLGAPARRPAHGCRPTRRSRRAPTARRVRWTILL